MAQDSLQKIGTKIITSVFDLDKIPKTEWINLVAIDIETTGLNYLEDSITIIGMWGEEPELQRTFNNAQELEQFLVERPELIITGHNFKFDAKFLIKAGIDKEWLLKKWRYDSNFLGSVCTVKPNNEYLELYERMRREINKTLPKGKGHRDAGPLSLKTQAPFWLGVDPFWEATLDHNNIEYVLKDAKYTFELTKLLYELVNIEKGSRTHDQLIERAKVVLNSEMTGIKIDMVLLNEMTDKVTKELEYVKAKIENNWADEFKQWDQLQRTELKNLYIQKCTDYCNNHNKEFKITWDNRYKKLYEKALLKIEPLNLGSPAQLTWLLKEALGLDITGLDGEESTDKEVLNMLSVNNPDIKDLLEFREKSKILNAFLPEYKEFAKHDGRIHTTFNITGARTGRVSSSGPNMQQVPGDLHKLFIADIRQTLITRDMAALEPVLIAYFTEDEALCDIVLNNKNFHSINTLIIFPELECDVSEIKSKYPEYRDAAKELGLSVLYGAGANRVHQSLTKRGFKFTMERCKNIVTEIRKFYKGVWAFKQELDSLAESGELFYNYMGRPLRFLNKDDVYMKAFNTLIQGSGSDIVMQSMVDISKNYNTIPLLSIHDEIVVQTDMYNGKNGSDFVEKEMTKWDLTNSKGPIKLKVEGNNNFYWSK